MNFLSSLKGWKCTVLSIILYCVPDTLKVNSGIQHFDGQHKAAQEQRIDSQDWPSLSLLYSYIPPPSVFHLLIHTQSQILIIWDSFYGQNLEDTCSKKTHLKFASQRSNSHTVKVFFFQLEHVFRSYYLIAQWYCLVNNNYSLEVYSKPLPYLLSILQNVARVKSPVETHCLYLTRRLIKHRDWCQCQLLKERIFINFLLRFIHISSVLKNMFFLPALPWPFVPAQQIWAISNIKIYIGHT